MPRRPSTFRQADIEKMIKGAMSAGASDVRVEVEPTGKLVLVTGAAARAHIANSFD